MGRYVTVADIRERLDSMGRDDGAIGRAIDASESLIDESCGRWFDLRAGSPVLFEGDSHAEWIWIGDAAGGVASVEYSTSPIGMWTDIKEFWSRPGGTIERGAPHNLLWLDRSYMCRTNKPIWLKVTPVKGWGWPNVPAPIVEATTLHTTKLVKRRETPEGVMGFEGAGLMTVDRKGLDGDAVALIRPYTRIESMIQ